MEILCDNQQTVGLVTKETPKLNTKLRHVDVHQHWLRQEVQAKNVAVTWIPTSAMPADGLTKRLSIQQHRKFVQQLGMIDIKPLIDEHEKGRHENTLTSPPL
jgi:hypothetical protein